MIWYIVEGPEKMNWRGLRVKFASLADATAEATRLSRRLGGRWNCRVKEVIF